ncbi:MAG: HAD family hydrolase [Eubacteriales bacterium]
MESTITKNKKIVFLDIDGTLTTFGGVLPDSAAEALREAKENGNELVLCTGRTVTQIYPMLRDSGLFSGLVCGAGAEVWRNGKTIVDHFVDPAHLSLIVDYLESVHSRYYLQCRSGMYGTSAIVNYNGVMFGGDPGSTKEREKIFGHITVDDEPKKRRDVNKLAYYEADADIHEIRAALGDYFSVMESSFRLSDKSDGEVTIRGYDKAYGMRVYLEDSGLSAEDTIAFGDGPNDYEMIDFAHVGVAMGNAADDLKKHADFVTDRVDHDGLAKAFYKLGLSDSEVR